MLKDGDTVKLTQSAVVLESLIGQFLYNKAAEGGSK
jgi:phospholipid/cholesterol/gamma-HCH transport system substrate-binding protein